MKLDKIHWHGEEWKVKREEKKTVIQVNELEALKE